MLLNRRIERKWSCLTACVPGPGIKNYELKAFLTIKIDALRCHEPLFIISQY